MANQAKADSLKSEIRKLKRTISTLTRNLEAERTRNVRPAAAPKKTLNVRRGSTSGGVVQHKKSVNVLQGQLDQANSRLEALHVKIKNMPKAEPKKVTRNAQAGNQFNEKIRNERRKVRTLEAKVETLKNQARGRTVNQGGGGGAAVKPRSADARRVDQKNLHMGRPKTSISPTKVTAHNAAKLAVDKAMTSGKGNFMKGGLGGLALGSIMTMMLSGGKKGEAEIPPEFMMQMAQSAPVNPQGNSPDLKDMAKMISIMKGIQQIAGNGQSGQPPIAPGGMSRYMGSGLIA